MNVLDLNEEEKKEIEERNKLKRNQKISDLKKVLSFQEGRRFIWRILQDAEPFQTCFDTNALTMAHKAGFKDFALNLIDDLNRYAPGSYQHMQKEAIAEKVKKSEE